MAAVATAVTVMVGLLEKFASFGITVTVQNHTELLLRHQSYYKASGEMPGVVELPTVYPSSEVGSENYYDSETVALSSVPIAHAPGYVLIWNILRDKQLYLILVVENTGSNIIYQHRYSYRIEKEKREPKWYWDNKNDDNFFRDGDVKEHCDTGKGSISGLPAVDGIKLTGWFGHTDNNAIMNVGVTVANDV